MAAGSFPSDPCNRKVILVLNQHDLEKCAYEVDAARALLDEEAYVLRFPVGIQDHPPAALQNLLDAGLARSGGMLVQSPYDADTYEDALLASQRFALAKHMYFSNLCMLLGAKEVSVDQVEVRMRSSETTVDAGGKRHGVGAQVTAESKEKEKEKFQAQMNLRDEFEGGPPDVTAAERLLRRTGLWSDPNMRSLLEMRRDGSNQLKARKLVLSLSSEAERNLNVVARLNVPTCLSISGEYKRVIHEQYDYLLTVLVRF